MKTSHLIIGGAAAAALAYLAWSKVGRGAELATVRNDAKGPRLPSLPDLPPLPGLPPISGAVPNMPRMPAMPSMGWTLQ